MSPIGRVLLGLFAEKASVHVQKAQPIQKLARETAKLEHQGISGAANLVAATFHEVASDVKHIATRWFGSSAADENQGPAKQLETDTKSSQKNSNPPQNK